VGLTILPCKKKIVEKPPRNSAGFCGGGQGLSWAVEPRKEERGYTCNLSLYKADNIQLNLHDIKVKFPCA
jgi:hypothetical protein